MIWFVGGLGALAAALLAMRWFSAVDPARAARWVGWGGVVALVAVAVLFATRQAFGAALLSLAGAGAVRALAEMGRGWLASRGAGGRRSSIETGWLRMTLDHESGETDGVVLQGRFAGAALGSLSVEALLALLGELRVSDPEGAHVLEAYIARVHPDAVAPRGASSAGGMSRAEALEVLGLGEDADEEAIREAHRRLVRLAHPDGGGTDYLASKINEARDVLLD